jgi:nonsense-mediated mRNA decay protein 3
LSEILSWHDLLVYFDLVYRAYTTIHLDPTSNKLTKEDRTAIKMVAMDYDPEAAAQESYILCADCGTVIPASNGAGLCECFVSDFGLPGQAFVMGSMGGLISCWGIMVMGDSVLISYRCRMSTKHGRHH